MNACALRCGPVMPEDAVSKTGGGESHLSFPGGSGGTSRRPLSARKRLGDLENRIKALRLQKSRLLVAHPGLQQRRARPHIPDARHRIPKAMRDLIQKRVSAILNHPLVAIFGINP